VSTVGHRFVLPGRVSKCCGMYCIYVPKYLAEVYHGKKLRVTVAGTSITFRSTIDKAGDRYLLRIPAKIGKLLHGHEIMLEIEVLE